MGMISMLFQDGGDGCRRRGRVKADQVLRIRGNRYRAKTHTGWQKRGLKKQPCGDAREAAG